MRIKDLMTKPYPKYRVGDEVCNEHTDLQYSIKAFRFRHFNRAETQNTKQKKCSGEWCYQLKGMGELWYMEHELYLAPVQFYEVLGKANGEGIGKTVALNKGRK